MPRSYGSYFQERKKDKPYRAAEIALGFLGNIMESKNVQALQYDKLLAEKEKAEALQTYRTESLGVQKQALSAKTIQHDPRKGSMYQFDPDTGTYNAITGTGTGTGGPGGGAGAFGTNWGQFYTDLHLDTYLDGHIEYGEDANRDGVPDRTFVGPDAQLFRDYKTAKANKTEGWEALHPDAKREEYLTYKGTNEDMANEITDYFDGIEKYQDLYEDNQLLASLTKDPYLKEDDVRLAYGNIKDKYKPKPMTPQQRIGAQNLVNRRNVLRGYLEGQTSVTRFTDADGLWDEDTGLLEQESLTLKKVEMTEELKTSYLGELQGIEGQLKKLGVQYSEYKPYDPLGILGK